MENKKWLIQTMHIITQINRSMMMFMGIILTLMSILLTYDVIMRYFFNSPTSWAFELAIWGTGIIGFMLGGYTLAVGQHVRVDVFFEHYSLKKKSIIDLISSFFLLLIAVAFVWLGSSYVINYFQIGAISTGGTGVPLWIKWLIVPIGGLLIGLQCIVKLINDLSIIFKGKVLYEMNFEEENN